MADLAEMRDEPLVGEVAFRIGPADQLRPLLFHEATNTAYYLTLDALRNFEAMAAVGPGPFVVPAVAFWFMATESYISTIYKTCDAIDAALGDTHAAPAGGRLRKTRQLVEKAIAVKAWVAADCDPEPPKSRLLEFATFRNALFHDLTSFAPRTEYRHTRFAPRAEKCNQVDLIEAVRVSLEVFGHFRSIFGSSDLMPSIHLGFGFEKVDALVAEVIEPAFAEILTAKNLEAMPSPDPIRPCPAELRVPLEFFISTQGPLAPTSEAEGEEAIADRYQAASTRARPIDEDKFRVPDYSRRSHVSHSPDQSMRQSDTA
ncbi:MAG TPA: hypothetical protein VIY71_03890 [Solirubrobacterales bacterium]